MTSRCHKKYSSLLKGVKIDRPIQVWRPDIPDVPMPSGFLYLVATIDWFSRLVVRWRLSNTRDGGFCLAMREESLTRGRAEIFQFGSGGAIHGNGLDESIGVGGDSGEQGWWGALPRYYFCGASLAKCEVRGAVSETLCDGAGVGGGVDGGLRF